MFQNPIKYKSLFVLFYSTVTRGELLTDARLIEVYRGGCIIESTNVPVVKEAEHKAAHLPDVCQVIRCLLFSFLSRM